MGSLPRLSMPRSWRSEGDGSVHCCDNFVTLDVMGSPVLGAVEGAVAEAASVVAAAAPNHHLPTGPDGGVLVAALYRSLWDREPAVLRGTVGGAVGEPVDATGLVPAPHNHLPPCPDRGVVVTHASQRRVRDAPPGVAVRSEVAPPAPVQTSTASPVHRALVPL